MFRLWLATSCLPLGFWMAFFSEAQQLRQAEAVFSTLDKEVPAYSIGGPSPAYLPYDLIYDVFLEQQPTEDRYPQGLQAGDIELEVYLDYPTLIRPVCKPFSMATTFQSTVNYVANGFSTQGLQTWEMCETFGLAGKGTTVSIWPDSPLWGTSSGSVGIALGQFPNQGS